jgi:hypothetical protein
MVMLAEDYDFVIGGDPDRDSIDLAVVDATTGGVRGQIVEITDVKRSRGARSDRIDAIAAARTALSQERKSVPRVQASGGHCGRSWPPGRRFWSAAPGPSTSSRA